MDVLVNCLWWVKYQVGINWVWFNHGSSRWKRGSKIIITSGTKLFPYWILFWTNAEFGRRPRSTVKESIRSGRQDIANAWYGIPWRTVIMESGIISHDGKVLNVNEVSTPRKALNEHMLRIDTTWRRQRWITYISSPGIGCHPHSAQICLRLHIRNLSVSSLARWNIHTQDALASWLPENSLRRFRRWWWTGSRQWAEVIRCFPSQSDAAIQTVQDPRRKRSKAAMIGPILAGCRCAAGNSPDLSSTVDILDSTPNMHWLFGCVP